MSNKTLVKGVPLYSRVTPDIKTIFPQPVKRAIKIVKNVNEIIQIIDGTKSLSDSISDRIVGKIIGKISNPIKNLITPDDTLNLSFGFSWFGKEKENERKIVKCIVVFHNANKAGPHLDVHIDGISFVVRVPQSMGMAEVRKNLTKQGKDALISYLRDEGRAANFVE